jgi:hypothetical protein
MNISLKVQSLHPSIDFGDPLKGFRHPQHGLNNCPTIDDWDACVWSPSNGVPKPTAQELTDAPYPADYQRDVALSAIYEPVEYNGTLYPADQASMAKYEMAKQSRTRGKATKGIAVAVDGSVLKLSTPAEIDSFHGAIEDAIVARLNAAHDAL